MLAYHNLFRCNGMMHSHFQITEHGNLFQLKFFSGIEPVADLLVDPVSPDRHRQEFFATAFLVSGTDEFIRPGRGQDGSVKTFASADLRPVIKILRTAVKC